MATYDLEEQERIDALKDWWKHNGRTVYAAIIGVVIVASGIQGWRYYQAQQRAEAAALFEQLEAAVKANQGNKIKDVAASLVQSHAGSVYAIRAALLAAKTQYQGGDAEGARKQYEWVLNQAGAGSFQGVARVRLAAVLLEQKKYDAALKLLDGNKDEAFSGLVGELKGDAYSAKGKTAEARAAYKAMLEAAPANDPIRQIVQLKLDALGESP